MRQRSVNRVRGLTLVEILIAIVIVSVGIIGVLALVTATLKSSGVIIESSFASTIGRSVYEALRTGARQRSFIVPQGTKYVKGFCFVHDGVLDTIGGTPSYAPPIAPQVSPVDATLYDGLQRSDFAVFLPPSIPAGATGSAQEKIYVFPRPQASKADGTVDDTQTKAENAGETDDSFNPPHAGYGGNTIVFDVRRVYQLKNRSVSGGGTTTGGTPTYLSQGDAADQYGFAFTVRRAKAPDLVDTNGATLPFSLPSGALDPVVYPPGAQSAGVATHMSYVDGLYQIEVMVFRNFEPFAKASAATSPDIHEVGRTHEPVGRFVGLIAIGG